MIWHFISLVVPLLGDRFRFSRLTPEDQTLELLMLGPQLLIWRRHQKRGPSITRTEKRRLLPRMERFRPIIELPKAPLEQLIRIFKPDTLLGWHRALVKRKWSFNQPSKQVGRSPVEPPIIQWVLPLARENRWGDDRITGERKKLGSRIRQEKVRQLLPCHGILPVPDRRPRSTWRTLLNHYQDPLLACDCFTVETVRLQPL